MKCSNFNILIIVILTILFQFPSFLIAGCPSRCFVSSSLLFPIKSNSNVKLSEVDINIILKSNRRIEETSKYVIYNNSPQTIEFSLLQLLVNQDLYYFDKPGVTIYPPQEKEVKAQCNDQFIEPTTYMNKFLYYKDVFMEWIKLINLYINLPNKISQAFQKFKKNIGRIYGWKEREKLTASTLKYLNTELNCGPGVSKALIELITNRYEQFPFENHWNLTSTYNKKIYRDFLKSINPEIKFIPSINEFFINEFGYQFEFINPTTKKIIPYENDGISGNPEGFLYEILKYKLTLKPNQSNTLKLVCEYYPGYYDNKYKQIYFFTNTLSRWNTDDQITKVRITHSVNLCDNSNGTVTIPKTIIKQQHNMNYYTIPNPFKSKAFMIMHY